MEIIQEEVNEQKSSMEENSPVITSTKAKHQKTYSELNRIVREKENFIERLMRENKILKEELEDGKLLIMSISEESHPNIITPTLEKPSMNNIQEQAFKIRNLDTGQEIDVREGNLQKLQKQLMNIQEENLEIDPLFESDSLQKMELQQQLFKAIEESNVEMVQYLLDKSTHGDLTPSVNFSQSDNYTALHLASNFDNEQILAALLDFGQDCDIQAKTINSQKTPLHIATQRGLLGIVRLLVRAGADVNTKDVEGNTPLHIACQLGYLDIIKFLLSRKNINTNQKNIQGKTPQQLAKDQRVWIIFEADQQINKEIALKPHQDILQKIQIHSSKQQQIQQLLISPKNQNLQQNYMPQQQIKLSNQPIKSKINEQLEKLIQLQQQQSFESEEEEEEILSLHSSDDETTQNSSTSEKIGPQHFEIKGQLGKGSFGEVWLVQKRDSMQLYAMKILSKDKIIGHNLIRYAMTERNVLSYSQHPFVIGLNFAFQTKDYLYLILDYAPCGDLGYHLQRERRFAEWRAKIYICEIILALEYLHQKDIIFRDLKPENVVLDSQGHAMLTDFGLSKEGVCFEKQATSFCGSIAYLAPEMLKKIGHGKPVDWYLLGVLLYEMLTGAPPYYNPNKEQLFANIEKGKLRMPNYVSVEARNLMKQLLEKNPAKRLGFNGVEEIKVHEFFKGIEWETVYRRELRPPIPLPKKVNMKKPLDMSKMQSETHDSEKNKLFGWTFVSKE